MVVTFFCGAVGQLNATERKRLFGLINNLPDVYEVVRKWRPVENRPRKEDNPGEASGSKSSSSICIMRLSDGSSRSSKSTQQIGESHVVNDNHSKGSLCGRCGGSCFLCREGT
ncbi:hypothetical protein L1987_09804 [Smallanthus sonchifolius]|uniref:Uncharacterized protein n=1 Tax=Smallanthus sonchifolius TaxID=185202 RepID=A0ACB9JQC0_9ASTR|nr:hypothetical protein L1987_09804 [Smallanthus sonchifolius]